MNLQRDHILKAQEFIGIDEKELSKTRLIIESGHNHFATGRALAEIYEKEIGTSKDSLKKSDRVILIEPAFLKSQYYFLRRVLRQIPGSDSFDIIYSGYGSFTKSVLPLVLIGRFFGKIVRLFYYPGESIEFAPGRVSFSVLALCNRIYVGSRYLQRQLSREEIKSEVFLPPSDSSIFKRKEITSVQPNILTIQPRPVLEGLFTVLKGFELAKQKYPRAEMTILTIGANVEQLQNLVSYNKINGISIRSLEETNSIESSICAADTFIDCSTSESISIAMTSAMSAGLPVISFDTSGARELIEDGQNGLLVKHKDTGGLAGAIIDLVESPEIVAKISREAKTLV